MIKKITIEVIPHLEQRYNTVGDWQFERSPEGEPTALNIKVSDLDDQAYFILIGLHEAIEALLCEKRGVKESEVDQFDLNWKPSRVHWSSDTVPNEPGEDYYSPYYQEHQIATGIERLLAARMFTNWARYEALVDELIKDSEVYFAQKALGEVVEEPKEEITPILSEQVPIIDPSKSDDFDDDIPF